MINFTAEQEEVLQFLMAQLEPNGHNVVVSGSGGTGKTTVICELICRLLEEGFSVAVMAMTGKATSVLRAKINEAILEKGIDLSCKKLQIDTVAKITKKSRPLTVKQSGQTVFSNVWRDPDSFQFDVLIIDELSMVPSYVGTWWQKTGARVFGFGDECQLPEVAGKGLNDSLKEFCRDLKLPDAGYIPRYGTRVLKDLATKTLHKVLRSDNEIALLCGELRDFSMTKTECVATIQKWAKKSENIEYVTSMDQAHTEPDWQIICFTNKKCDEINSSLSIGQGYPNLRDKILVYDNLNKHRIYNGETMLFEDFLRQIGEYDLVVNQTFDKEMALSLETFVCVKWEDRLPSMRSPFPIERNFAILNNVFKEALATANAKRVRMFGEWLKKSCKELGRATAIEEAWLQKKEALMASGQADEDIWINLLTAIANEDITLATKIQDMASPLPNFQFVNLGLGYAITTHKSQGSEYEKVCYILERFDRPLLYTGLSRAKKKLQIVNLTRVM